MFEWKRNKFVNDSFEVISNPKIEHYESSISRSQPTNSYSTPAPYSGQTTSHSVPTIPHPMWSSSSYPSPTVSTSSNSNLTSSLQQSPPSLQQPTPSQQSLPSPQMSTVHVHVNPIALFVLFLIAYLALDAWARVGEGVVSKVFNHGMPLTTFKIAIFAVLMTLIMFVFAYFFNIPVITVESL